MSCSIAADPDSGAVVSEAGATAQLPTSGGEPRTRALDCRRARARSQYLDPMSHLLRRVSLPLAALLALPAGVAAQDAGAPSVRADVSVTVPTIVRLRSAEVSAVDAGTSADGAADLAVTLRVVANVGYRIVLRPASPWAAGVVRVRASDGSLVPLSVGRAVPVLAGRAGRSAPVVLLRVARAAGASRERAVVLVAEAVPLSGEALVLSSLTFAVPPAAVEPARDGGDR